MLLGHGRLSGANAWAYCLPRHRPSLPRYWQLVASRSGQERLPAERKELARIWRMAAAAKPEEACWNGQEARLTCRTTADAPETRRDDPMTQNSDE